MLIIEVSGGINGKSNLRIKHGHHIYSCELENPKLCIPNAGGMMKYKDVENLIKFLSQFDKDKT